MALSAKIESDTMRANLLPTKPVEEDFDVDFIISHFDQVFRDLLFLECVSIISVLSS